MATLQAQLAQVITTTPRQSDDNTATPSLHSLSARPHYEWTPSEAHQVNMLHMDVPIHTSKPMTSADRKFIIEAYPPVAQLEYRSPATVPSAEQSMNKVQKMEDDPLLNYRAQGHWTVKEAAQSINRREELKAAHLALKTFHMPPNSTVLIRTDNTTSMSYINKQNGTRSLPLLELATEVWTWCLQHKIMIQAQHIQGLQNTIADFESRRKFFKNQ